MYFIVLLQSHSGPRNVGKPFTTNKKNTNRIIRNYLKATNAGEALGTDQAGSCQEGAKI